MLVLGIQGSPRLNGNAAQLLSVFMDSAKALGAETLTINVCEKKIAPCEECLACEQSGHCRIDDDMNDIFVLLQEADVIVLSGPVFFYGFSAQLKALIDRAQTLWSRKHLLKLNDPGSKWRTGLLLAVGATKGAALFDGMSLTAKYFFEAIGAQYKDKLVFSKIEKAGDILKHPTAFSETREKARLTIEPLTKRKKILFACKENACRSQISATFARHYAGDTLDVKSAGSSPAKSINEKTITVMAETGLDLEFIRPKLIQDATKNFLPDIIVTMGCEEMCPVFPGAKIINWNLPDPADKPLEFMRALRDEIKQKIFDLKEDLQ